MTPTLGARAWALAATSLLLPTALHSTGPAAAAAEVQRLVGDAVCSSDAHCSTLPLPDQACGGPRGWVAYAPARTDTAALRRALQGLAEQAPGSAHSTCAVVPDPGAVCGPPPGAPRARRSCHLRSAAPGTGTR